MVLAFRNGMEVKQDNFEFKFDQIRNKSLKLNNFDALKTNNNDDYLMNLKEMIEKVFNGEISLSNATNVLTNDEA